MSQQAIRQAARRTALDVQSRRRRERAEREHRLESIAVQVLTAMGDRDAAVVAAEHRAGAALRKMTDSEGLTVREAVEWCGDQITVREVTRLRRVTHETDEEARPGHTADYAGAQTAAAAERAEVRARDLGRVVAGGAWWREPSRRHALSRAGA